LSVTLNFLADTRFHKMERQRRAPAAVARRAPTQSFDSVISDSVMQSGLQLQREEMASREPRGSRVRSHPHSRRTASIEPIPNGDPRSISNASSETVASGSTPRLDRAIAATESTRVKRSGSIISDKGSSKRALRSIEKIHDEAEPPVPLGASQDTLHKTNSMQAGLSKIQASVTCTICIQLLYEPYTLGCGHTFCYGVSYQGFSLNLSNIR
jgi:hypothetical protein